ncbi:MAG: PIN domain-containing protein [Anaerosomatales bacterium]|nr:PIN domain-containing protein [Anaerosomatales bacterium]
MRMRTVILDTNVLLSDPETLLAFPDAEVIVPDVVLGEIDKLKMQRVDPDLRYKGREVSRMLFEMSEGGSLTDGVETPEGGRIRVVGLAPDTPMPEGLSAKNADDRILAVALQMCSEGCEDLTLVTNDLNMLIKAQTLGIKVERRPELEGGFARKYIIRPFQRYRVPLTILAVAVGVFAGVLALAFYTTSLTGRSRSADVPTEFRDLLTTDQRTLLDGLTRLESSPNDAEAMKSVANAYYNLRDQTGNVQFARKAIDYYQRYLKLRPDDVDARTDLAAMLFYSGSTDEAIQQATLVLETKPEHIQANFNLGIFYWRGRSDYKAAALQFKKVIDLTSTSGDAHAGLIKQQAEANLQSIIKEAEAAGQPLDVKALGIDTTNGGTTS